MRKALLYASAVAASFGLMASAHAAYVDLGIPGGTTIGEWGGSYDGPESPLNRIILVAGTLLALVVVVHLFIRVIKRRTSLSPAAVILNVALLAMASLAVGLGTALDMEYTLRNPLVKFGDGIHPAIVFGVLALVVIATAVQALLKDGKGKRVAGMLVTLYPILATLLVALRWSDLTDFWQTARARSDSRGLGGDAPDAIVEKALWGVTALSRSMLVLFGVLLMLFTIILVYRRIKKRSPAPKPSMPVPPSF